MVGGKLIIVFLQGMYGRALEEIPSLMRDAQYVSELTPVVETDREKVTLISATQ